VARIFAAVPRSRQWVYGLALTRSSLGRIPSVLPGNRLGLGSRDADRLCSRVCGSIAKKFMAGRRGPLCCEQRIPDPDPARDCPLLSPRQLICSILENILEFCPQTGRRDLGRRPNGRKFQATKVRFHDCRHTFCTRAINAGVLITKVAKLVGRQPSTMVAMTGRYGHHGLEDLRSAVETVGCSGNGETNGEIAAGSQNRTQQYWISTALYADHRSTRKLDVDRNRSRRLFLCACAPAARIAVLHEQTP
jgi:hypothetical protein